MKNLDKMKPEMVAAVQDSFEKCRELWPSTSFHSLSMGDKTLTKYDVFIRAMYSALGGVFSSQGYEIQIEAGGEGRLLVRLPGNKMCQVAIRSQEFDEWDNVSDLTFCEDNIQLQAKDLVWQEIRF